MASVYYYCFEASRIENEIISKNLELEYEAKIKHISAIIIQKYWRSYKARQKIKRWNYYATVIQKYIRGWLVRWHMPEILKSYFDHMAISFYNEKATKIQAVWKGYSCRKTYNVKSNIKYREQIMEISNKLQEELTSLFRKNKNVLIINGEEVENKWLQQCLDCLLDKHHLLRTKTQEGVLSLHGKNQLSPLEILIKKLPIAKYFRQLKKICLYHKHKTTTPSKYNREGHIIHPKPFDLNTKLPTKPYESPLLL